MSSNSKPDHILTETIQVAYKFTRDELEALTNKMLTHMLSRDELERQKTDSNKDFALKIGVEESHIEGCAMRLRSREETRSTEARVEFDVVRRMKLLYTIPTDGTESEFIREEVMQPADFQTDMFKKTKAEWEAANPSMAQQPAETLTPVTPAPRTEQSKAEKKQAAAAERKQEEAGKTPLRLALEEASKDQPVNDLKWDVNAHYGTASIFVRDLKTAMKEAGWNKVQISTMEGALRACEGVPQMTELIRPFVKHEPMQPAGATDAGGDPTVL